MANDIGAHVSINIFLMGITISIKKAIRVSLDPIHFDFMLLGKSIFIKK